MTGSTGALFVHACPASLRTAVDTAVSSHLASQALFWSRHDDSLAVTAEWQGARGTGMALAEALRSLAAVTFEVTEDASSGVDGERFSFVPGLGMFRATTNAVGDVVVDENQLAAALRDTPNAEALHEKLARLIGRPWDDALEPLRMRGWAATPSAAAG